MRPHEEVEAHIRHFFEGHVTAEAEWHHGPSAELWPHLRYLAIAPGPLYRGWVYFTVGASEVASPHLEFFICSPHANESATELLAMATYYHATERLGLNHTLPIGRSWLPNATCDQFLVSLPYPFGPNLENIKASVGEVQALWLLPITEAERAFAKVHGVEALEALFDERAINPLDINRSSVV